MKGGGGFMPSNVDDALTAGFGWLSKALETGSKAESGPHGAFT